MHIAEIKQAAILLSFAIKPLGIRKLKGNSLTAPDRNRAVRLHDVFHASLDGSWCTNERSVELEHLLDTYLVEASRSEGLDLWRNARILLPKLEDMVARGGTPPVSSSRYLYQSSLIRTHMPIFCDRWT